MTNLQGDVIGVTTPDGESRAVYTYDPFGKPLTATGTMASINPLRYRGYYYDTESGLYYVKSRYYDPEICRWISADDASNLGIEGEFVSYNVFVYCGDNPVQREDDGGEFWHIVGAALLGGIISAGAEIASQLKNGATINSLDWTSVGIEAASGTLTGLAMVTLSPGAVTVAKAFISAGTSIAHYVHEKEDPRLMVINAAANAAESLIFDKVSNMFGDQLYFGKHERVSELKRLAHKFFSSSGNIYVDIAKELGLEGAIKLLVS